MHECERRLLLQISEADLLCLLLSQVARAVEEGDRGLAAHGSAARSVRTTTTLLRMWRGGAALEGSLAAVSIDLQVGRAGGFAHHFLL